MWVSADMRDSIRKLYLSWYEPVSDSGGTYAVA